MAIGKVEICGVDTSTLPVISNERMRELFPLVHGGDEAAREEFIRGNLRLVLSVLQRFQHRCENVDDLFQVGCIGLIKALDNFDVTQNVRFSTYAVPMIIGEIRRYLRDNNAIRVSRSLRDIAYKALGTRDRLSRELGREPTIAEIAKKLEMDVEDVTLALEAIQDPVSLCEPIGGDNADALTIGDQVRDESVSQESWLEHIAITEAMRRLSEREQRILNLRFFQGRTQMEVASEIGISQAQVSRLEKASACTCARACAMIGQAASASSSVLRLLPTSMSSAPVETCWLKRPVLILTSRDTPSIWAFMQSVRH